MGCEIVDKFIQKYSGPVAVGGVDAIYVAGERGSNLHELTHVQAIAGQGLEGDRYQLGRGSFSRWPGDGRAVSLIAAEVIDAIFGETGLDLSSGRSRRNVV